MFHNWLNSSNHIKTLNLEAVPASSIAHHIQTYVKEQSLHPQNQVALIGLDANQADAIRKYLYQLSYPFSKNILIDLGNLKKNTTSFIIPVLKELHDVQIIPVIIGGQSQHIYAQYQAHYTKRQLTTMVAVDDRIHFDTDTPENKQHYLSKILNNRKLFNLSVLACQTHFIPTSVSKYFSNRHFELVGLGKIRECKEEVEPILRDADLIAFNLPAIRHADIMGQHTSPNGLFGEEACQIARYAGLSDKLSSFGIYGFETTRDFGQQSAQLIAQVIWYFLQGIHDRKHDFPKSNAHLVEYIVTPRNIEHDITFWKSTKSGRWWMQIPIKTRKKHQRHYLVPCSYQDYQLATQGELSDRLTWAYQRFL